MLWSNDKNWLTFYWSSLYVHGYWILAALARISCWPWYHFYFTSLFSSGLKAHMFTVLPLIAGVAFDFGTYTIYSLWPGDLAKCSFLSDNESKLLSGCISSYTIVFTEAFIACKNLHLFHFNLVFFYFHRMKFFPAFSWIPNILRITVRFRTYPVVTCKQILQ